MRRIAPLSVMDNSRNFRAFWPLDGLVNVNLPARVRSIGGGKTRRPRVPTAVRWESDLI
jgi:hypothetical protein